MFHPFELKRLHPFQRAPDWLVTVINKPIFHNAWQHLADVDAEDLLREVLAAVSAAPVGEITGLHILSYVYHKNFKMMWVRERECWWGEGASESLNDRDNFIFFDCFTAD